MSWTKEQICKLAIELELKSGQYVNLGIGMPTDILNFLPKDLQITFQSENGMLGMGPFPLTHEVDPDLINAGKQTITAEKYASYFSSAASFDMIRGGHIDLTILGALEVSGSGDLANWAIPGKMIKGMGGAMDLVANVKRVVVLMEHVNKNGKPKLVKECELPLTGKSVVRRVITDLGVFDINNQKMILVQKPDNVSIDEIRAKTEAEFIVNF